MADSGVFDNLTYKFDGQDLIYTLVPSTSLLPIRLDNLPLTPGNDVDAKLHDRLPLYHGKVPSQGTLLDGVRAALQEMLANEGIAATIAATPGGVPGSRKITVMSFAITSQPVRVGPIHVESVALAMQAKVKLLADRTAGAPFETETAERDLQQAFESLYADEGYAAAKVHVSPSGNPVATTEAINVPFTVTVEEGRLYKLAAIHLPADALVTQAEIDKTVAVRNDIHVKGVTLHSAWSLISSRYKAKGHLDCIVTPSPEFDEAAGSVSYTVEINPGPVYHLAFVKFENLSDEFRSRLMRNWQMLPGDPFDESYVSNFIANVEKDDPVLQRSLTGVKITYDVHADPDSHEVNCVIRLEKPPPGP